MYIWQAEARQCYNQGTERNTLCTWEALCPALAYKPIFGGFVVRKHLHRSRDGRTALYLDFPAKGEVMPNASGEKPVLKFMFGAMIRTFGR
ncbi:MAG: hypothetical protein OXC41_01245 [Gammaproteobacteria bacterium]|nr:hypothetical protein [Gammaproteobacteria bacterium]